MNRDEYIAELHEIENEATERKAVLRAAYATENNPVKIGDYVQDLCQTIRVEKMERTIFTDMPELIYLGTTCKMNGDERKNSHSSEVHQCNLIKINGKLLDL